MVWHCWLPASCPLSPLSPGAQFTPWCQMGAAAAHQSLGPAICATFAEGAGQTWGCMRPGLLRRGTVSPAPWEMVVKVALTHICHVEPAGGDVLPVSCSEQRGQMSVPSHITNLCHGALEGTEGPPVASYRQVGQGQMGGISSACSCGRCKGAGGGA